MTTTEDQVSETGHLDDEQVDKTVHLDEQAGGANATPDADDEQTDEPEQFPREYVEKLRKESAGYRDKAKRTDELAAALWAARVEASGKLADPTDLPLPTDADPTDPEAVTAAVDELLQRKPHLASRKVTGDVGQGQAGGGGTVDLAGLLRARA